MLILRCDLNTLRLGQNGRHFPDDIFKCIFLNENQWISIKMPLKFVPNVWISNIPALIQIMAWCRPGDKPLSGPMMVSLLTHVCVTRPQWVQTGLTSSHFCLTKIAHSKVHVANMGPTWVLLAPGGPHVGPMNLAIWECSLARTTFLSFQDMHNRLPACPLGLETGMQWLM